MSNTTKVTCPRCAGAKRFECFYRNNGGICYQCKGAGVVEVKPGKQVQTVAAKAPMSHVSMTVSGVSVTYYPSTKRADLWSPRMQGQLSLTGEAPRWLNGASRLTTDVRDAILAALV